MSRGRCGGWRVRRASTALCLALVLVGALPGRASAHSGVTAPAATRYRAKITSVPNPIEAKVVDGDQRLWLSVPPRLPVTVIGLRGEPYLRFSSGGIDVNRRSPTYFLNRARPALPPDLPAGAQPDWRRISDRALDFLARGPAARAGARGTFVGGARSRPLDRSARSRWEAVADWRDTLAGTSTVAALVLAACAPCRVCPGPASATASRTGSDCSLGARRLRARRVDRRAPRPRALRAAVGLRRSTRISWTHVSRRSRPCGHLAPARLDDGRRSHDRRPRPLPRTGARRDAARSIRARRLSCLARAGGRIALTRNRSGTSVRRRAQASHARHGEAKRRDETADVLLSH